MQLEYYTNQLTLVYYEILFFYNSLIVVGKLLSSGIETATSKRNRNYSMHTLHWSFLESGDLIRNEYFRWNENATFYDIGHSVEDELFRFPGQPSPGARFVGRRAWRRAYLLLPRIIERLLRGSNGDQANLWLSLFIHSDCFLWRVHSLSLPMGGRSDQCRHGFAPRGIFRTLLGCPRSRRRCLLPAPKPSFRR